MIEYGMVTDIRQDTALVTFRRTSACGRCRACGMLANQNEIVVEVKNELNAVVGDRVAVSIRMQKAMAASVLAYVFPLFMLIAGVVFGWLFSDVWHVFSNAEIAMALCAIIFVIIAFLLLKIAAPIYNKAVRHVYKMVNTDEADNADRQRQ